MSAIQRLVLKRCRSLSRDLFIMAALLLPMLLFGGCGGDSGPQQPSPVVAESFRTDDNRNIAIKADALNREFLLQGNLVELDSARQFHGLKSRIVVFQKQQGKLFMLESQVGHTVMPDSPFALILAEFPIVSEADGWIYFNFNQGMSQIFTTADMYTSDAPDGVSYQPSFKAAIVRSSFISSVQINGSNRLAVNQSAQLNDDQGTLPSVEVRYYLSPYLPDSSFKPTPSPGFTHAGYFEVMPQLESGGSTKVLAMKWNLRTRPIVYYLSANTPQEYRQAIRSGVLYWNAALGEEIFAVADAPAGVSAPDMDRNLIQWVEDDNAGAAYADIQADPRTGEILHAQIFLPSTFAVGSKKQAWRFLATTAASSAPSSGSLIALRNLYAGRSCDLSVTQRLRAQVAALLASNATDDQYLKAAQAAVLETLAHEVGHTMGLRHNFAGSLYADYAGHTRSNLYANFLNSGPYIKVIPSSSIMDYNQDIEAALVANRYQVEQQALPHDISAMRFLYQDKALDTTIPFCTDTDTETTMLDCRRFDFGNSPLEYVSSDLKQALSVDVLPISFYLDLVTEVMAGESVASLHPSASQKAAQLLANKPLLLAAFTQKGFYARVLKQYYPGTALKDADQAALRRAVIPMVRSDLDKWLQSNLYGLRSVTEMFMVIDPAWKDLWIARFNQITNDPAFYTITNPAGKTVTFSQAEREQLRGIAASFFAELIPALTNQDLKGLTSVTAKIDIVDGTAGTGLLAAMNATGSGYLQARTGGSLKETVNGVALTLPEFRYDWMLRRSAARLLENRVVPSALWWGVRETTASTASLSALLDSSVLGLGGSFNSPQVTGAFAGASNSAYQWYLENMNIIKCVGSTDPLCSETSW